MQTMLDKLKNNREYVLKNREELMLGSEPCPLFQEGLFNKDNWSGGDDVIRQFAAFVENKTDWYEVYTKDQEALIVRFVYEDDEKYLYVTHVEREGNASTWYFNWYKNRGRLSSAVYEGGLMKEVEYVELLNHIEDMVGFVFEFHK